MENPRRPNAGCHIKSTITALHAQMRRLAASLGESEQAPLDWITKPGANHPLLAIPDSGSEVGQADEANDRGPMESSQSQDGARDRAMSQSYGELDIDIWRITYARPRSLTFPPDEAELLDGQIPEITEVWRVYSW